MSDFKPKLNTGYIFKNKYKEEGDSKPEYKGTINVDGHEKELALWVNREKGYFSAKISDLYKKTVNESDDFLDDLPI